MPRTRLFVSLALGLLGTAPALEAALRDSADLRNRHVGAAVNMTPFRNETPYRDTLSREFNMLVAENAFKFDALHPSATTFNFTDADALVAFAEANNMAVRGHTLVWHSQLPGWLTGGNFTRDQVIAIMRDHIQTVVGRYRGRIQAWDVVNEAMADGTGQLRTDSFWHQRIGPEYIRMAFEFARDADPNAILYYNDYSAEGIGQKSDAIFNMVRDLRAQGVPVHGVGWQMHQVNPFRIQAQHRQNMQRLADLGLEISITEMDVRIQLPTDATKLQQQALAYSDTMQLCLEQLACKAVVTWGFTDKYSWVPGFFQGFGDALIFDTNYQPKPAYTALLQVLDGGTGAAFTLSASPGSLSVNRGGSGTSAITITRTGGFSSSVALSASGLPAGVTASFNPASTTGTTSTLTLTASSTAGPATATVTITGSGGSLTRTTTLALTVNVPDFTLGANPPSVTVAPGACASSTITITRSGGFTGPVTFSASGLPAGWTASFNPNPATGNSTVLTLCAPAGAAAGSLTLNFTATGGGLTRSFAISATVSASNFTLAANPSSLTVARAASGATNIAISRVGFTSAVAFTASGLPAGVTASFNPTSTTGNSSTLTLSASATAATGLSTVTVTGTGGGLTRTTTVSLTVVITPDFTLAASPSTVTVSPGGTATSIVSITRPSGFTATVVLTASGLPAGVTAGFNPASATGNSSTLTFTAAAGAAASTSTVTVTGTGGGLTRSTAIALTVSGGGGGTGGVTVTPAVTSSSPWFNEEQIRVNNTAPLTALSVTIVIQRTTGISFSGLYNTVGGQILQSNSSTTAQATYTFTLAAGQTLGTGLKTFAAQTSGTGTVHPTAGDTYVVTYTTGGQMFTQTGHF